MLHGCPLCFIAEHDIDAPETSDDMLCPKTLLGTLFEHQHACGARFSSMRTNHDAIYTIRLGSLFCSASYLYEVLRCLKHPTVYFADNAVLSLNSTYARNNLNAAATIPHLPSPARKLRIPQRLSILRPS